MMTDPRQVSEALGLPFSDEQVAAIAAPLEPGVIVAGAGCGKTTVMAARVVWLVGSGQVRREQVLGLTFTRKAAAELAAKVASALDAAGVGAVGADDAEELILTYDAFAGRLVDDYGLYVGVEPGRRMITGAARFQVAYDVVAQAAGPLPALERLSPATVARRVLELDSELRSHLAAFDAVEASAARFLAALDEAPRNRAGNVYAAVAKAAQAVRERLELLGLVRRYEAAKAELGFVEFADQMAVAAQLAADVRVLAVDARRAWRVVLLDEYQDTSAAQAMLLRRLFSGDDAEDGRGHPVTAVGDPCQAIYGWRGAAAGNMASFASQFPRADGQPAASYPLTVNRRSGQRILDAAHTLAAGIGGQHLKAADGTAPGTIDVAVLSTWPDEVGWLADEIVALHDSGQVPGWGGIAVLARRNSQLADVYAGLAGRGVPVHVVGIGGLLDVPVVAEVVATLRALADPTDNPAVIRLLTSSRWAIGLSDLAALGARAHALAREGATDPAARDSGAKGPAATDPGALGESLLEAAANPGDAALSDAARERLAAFSRQMASLMGWTSGSLGDLVAQVVAVSGLDVQARVDGDFAECLEAFAQVADAYADMSPASTLAGFLAYLEAERAEGVGFEQPGVVDEDSVALLSVHRAKGLEWDAVFLPGLADGVFPMARVSTFLSSAAAIPAELRGDADSVPQVRDVTNAGLARYLEEVGDDARRAEDRLAYVAVTRAKRIVVASTHRWEQGLVGPRGPSPYLDALREHAVRITDAQDDFDVNPLAESIGGAAWPDVGDPDARRRREQAAAWVREGPGTIADVEADVDAGLDADDRQTYHAWQARARALLREANEEDRARHEVVAPDYLSVTALASALADPGAFAASLAHPAPHLADRAAAAGTQAHRWIESHLTRPASFDFDDAGWGDDDGWSEDDAGRGDAAAGGREPHDGGERSVGGERAAAALRASPYADLAPVAVEFPFTLTLSGRVIRGRIDAVFAGRDGFAYQVVDWKTGDARRADPLQLACYRLAWAELHGLDVAEVDAVFFDLGRGNTVRPQMLPGRAELERMIVGHGVTDALP